MISGGDELSRTQKGNNNGYCHDNELSWYSWEIGKEEKQFLEFVKRVGCHQKESAGLFFAVTFSKGIRYGARKPRTSRGSPRTETKWPTRTGRTPLPIPWEFSLGGEALNEIDEMGRPIRGETLLLLLNSGIEEVSFVLPSHNEGGHWKLMLDTIAEEPGGRAAGISGGGYCLSSQRPECCTVPPPPSRRRYRRYIRAPTLERRGKRALT